MAREGGYLCISDPENGVTERSTITCTHCNGIVVFGPKQRPEDMGGFCRLCAKPVCAGCHARGSCTPFEKRLEQHEARYHALRSYGA